MGELPNWLTRFVIVAMLGWVTYTTHVNTAKITGMDARLTMLVQFMIPANKLVRVLP